MWYPKVFRKNLIVLPMVVALVLGLAAGASIAQEPANACPIAGYPILACPVTNDAVIKAIVQVRLTGLVIRTPNVVNIQVTDGVVTLTGEVEDPNTRSIATILASSVRGVNCVDNQLSVLRFGSPETTLVATVKERLNRSAIVNPQRIHVTASGSVVRLTGLVDTEDDMFAAGQVAEWVYGVTAVQNNLTIIVPPQQ